MNREQINKMLDASWVNDAERVSEWFEAAKTCNYCENVLKLADALFQRTIYFRVNRRFVDMNPADQLVYIAQAEHALDTHAMIMKEFYCREPIPELVCPWDEENDE